MNNYVSSVLILTIVLYLSLGFNIPILRQVVCISYLIFVPGIVVLKALKVDHDKTSFMLYSTGLSIAILMFLGLAIDQLGLIFAWFTPLSIAPLTVAISGFTLVVVLATNRKDSMNKTQPSLGSNTMKISTLLRSIPFFLIPLFGIVGAILNNSLLLIVMIVAIAIVFAFCLYSKIVPEQLLVLAIFTVSIALLFHTSLISRYLMGWDIHLEDYVYKLVQTRGFWSPAVLGINTEVARFESVLSITILPNIFSVISNVSQEAMFKVIYPIIFSMIPLVLYQTYKAQLDKRAALLSVFFFIAQPYGFFGAEPLSLARQMIGELFLALSMYLMVDQRIETSRKILLFLVFGGALAVSHYALSYMYVVFLLLALIVLRKWDSRGMINVITVFIIFIMTFGWYTYVSNAPILKLETDANGIYNNFITDFLNPQARASAVSTLTAAPTGIVSLIHRSIFYLEIGLMVLGIVFLIFKRKKTMFNPVYAVMAVASMGLMILCIAIPQFAGILQFTRFYGITIIFLAPFFVMGGELVVEWLFNSVRSASKKIPSRLDNISAKKVAAVFISIVLISGFLFDVGLVDHLTNGYPDSLSLDNSRRMTSVDPSISVNYYSLFIPAEDVYSAIWVSHFKNSGSNVYSDDDAKAYVLASYSNISQDQIYPILTPGLVSQGSVFYLRYVNTVKNTLVSLTFSNTSDVLSNFNLYNVIYSNGGSDVCSQSG